MNASLLSFDRRGLRLSSLAILSAASLAACDTDRSVGPNPTTTPSAASLAKAPAPGAIQGGLAITIVDQKLQAPTSLGAVFSLQMRGQGAIVVSDNGKGDNNLAIGSVLVKGLTAGVYEICQKVAATDYVLPAVKCTSATVFGGGSSAVTFVNKTMARITARAIDHAFNFIGGAVWKLRDSTNTVLAQFTDNTGPDLDPTPGKIELKLATEGEYNICTVTPPAGYVFLSGPFCTPVQAVHGQTNSNIAEFWTYPVYSAYWRVTDGTTAPDGFFTPLGGSTFKVTDGNGITSTIVDNGANDSDARVGFLMIKLPSAGTYQVCQTVAAANHGLAIPSCKKTEVNFGMPAWLEWFINLPMQAS